MGEDFWEVVWNWLLTSGLRIVIIALGGIVGCRSVRILAARLESLIAGVAPTEDEAQRARTLARVVRSTALVIVVTVAGLMILVEVGLDIAPLIAGAGIAGVALGLGAQSLISDVIGGFFILMEDQFAVGDAIQVGSIGGGVEKMTLRATFLRDLEGTLHVIPNGEIRIVSNLTKGWVTGGGERGRGLRGGHREGGGRSGEDRSRLLPGRGVRAAASGRADGHRGGGPGRLDGDGADHGQDQAGQAMGSGPGIAPSHQGVVRAGGDRDALSSPRGTNAFPC